MLAYRAYQVIIISRIGSIEIWVFVFETCGTGRMARWLIVLSEFDLKYLTRKERRNYQYYTTIKSIKGRAVCESFS